MVTLFAVTPSSVAAAAPVPDNHATATPVMVTTAVDANRRRFVRRTGPPIVVRNVDRPKRLVAASIDESTVLHSHDIVTARRARARCARRIGSGALHEQLHDRRCGCNRAVT